MTKTLRLENGKVRIPDELLEKYDLDSVIEIVIEELTQAHGGRSVQLLLHLIPQNTQDTDDADEIRRAYDVLRGLTGLGGDEITDASLTIDDYLYGDKSPFASE